MKAKSSAEILQALRQSYEYGEAVFKEFNDATWAAAVKTVTAPGTGVVTVEYDALTGNPLGDSHVRPLYVYTPPGYDQNRDQRYPVLYLQHGGGEGACLPYLSFVG